MKCRGGIAACAGMASRALEEFLGDGVLKGLSGRFTEDGWDDVPTIKVITTDDMEALELNDAQRVSVQKDSEFVFYPGHNPFRDRESWSR